MRTVILFGLLCIAYAIGNPTGWELSDDGAEIGAIIFIMAIVFDLIDIAITIKKGGVR